MEIIIKLISLARTTSELFWLNALGKKSLGVRGGEANQVANKYIYFVIAAL